MYRIILFGLRDLGPPTLGATHGLLGRQALGLGMSDVLGANFGVLME